MFINMPGAPPWTSRIVGDLIPRKCWERLDVLNVHLARLAFTIGQEAVVVPGGVAKVQLPSVERWRSLIFSLPPRI